MVKFLFLKVSAKETDNLSLIHKLIWFSLENWRSGGIVINLLLTINLLLVELSLEGVINEYQIPSSLIGLNVSFDIIIKTGVSTHFHSQGGDQ